MGYGQGCKTYGLRTMSKPPYNNMDRFIFWRLKTAKADKICTKGNFDYYALTLDGYRLMFAKNRYRPDGLRLYIMGDELAKYLGFWNYDFWRERMHYNGVQWGRKMLSVEALQRHFK